MQEHSTCVSMKYSEKLLEFSNNEAGFATVKAWMEEVEEKHGKDVVIPGMELTGHYWLSWSVHAGQRNETSSCESTSCEKVKRAG